MRRRILLAGTLLLIGCIAVQAQIVVSDPAITIRNTVTAVVKELLANLQEQQRRQIRRMSRRLSFFTDLQKYKLPEPPRWRIHIFNDPEVVLFAGDYHAALNVDPVLTGKIGEEACRGAVNYFGRQRGIHRKTGGKHLR